MGAEADVSVHEDPPPARLVVLVEGAAHVATEGRLHALVTRPRAGVLVKHPRDHLGAGIGGQPQDVIVGREFASGLGHTPIIAAPQTALQGEPVIYFLLVDRFYNGNPANDGAIDLADPQAFHGGDLAGVTAKLDNLKEIGVDTLWLGPITQMRTEKFFQWGAYHGYWLHDPMALEPRFGTLEELATLRREADARGIRLVLDTVYNHLAPDHGFVQHHPEWFHGPSKIVDWNDPAQLQQGWVHGLPDLDQDNREVRGWLEAATDLWIERVGPAALRLDAVRHMSPEFVRAMGAEARSLGVETWGEIFDGNVATVLDTREKAGLDAVFDYPLYYALKDTACGDAPLAQLAAALDRSDHVPGHTWLTFVDNHDTPRILSACNGDAWGAEAAIALLFALRGRPVITWGTEYLPLGAEEPDNRADMRWDSLGVDRLAWLASLARQRRESPSLSHGDSRVIALGEHHVAWERTHGGERRWVLYNEGAESIDIAGVHFDPRTVTVYDPGTLPAPRVHGGTVRFKSSKKLPPGDRLVVVGDAPELGSWDPAHGVPVPGKVTLEDEVYLYKTVVLHADGRPPTWSEGGNRWIVGGGGVLRL